MAVIVTRLNSAYARGPSVVTYYHAKVGLPVLQESRWRFGSTKQQTRRRHFFFTCACLPRVLELHGPTAGFQKAQMPPKTLRFLGLVPFRGPGFQLAVQPGFRYEFAVACARFPLHRLPVDVTIRSQPSHKYDVCTCVAMCGRQASSPKLKRLHFRFSQDSPPLQKLFNSRCAPYPAAHAAAPSQLRNQIPCRCAQDILFRTH